MVQCYVRSRSAIAKISLHEPRGFPHARPHRLPGHHLRRRPPRARLQRRRAHATSTSAPSSRATSASTSPSSPRRWTPSPRANWPSPWPRKAASASSTRTCRSPQQTREVDKVKRMRERHHHRPDHAAARRDRRHRPQDHGAAQHQRRADHGQRLPARASSPAATCASSTDNNQKLAEVMTKDNLVTAPENTTLEEAERILTENKVEKLLLVDDKYRLRGLITIKDIDKMHELPARVQGRAGPAAGRGGGRRARLRAGRVADQGRAWMCWWSIRPTGIRSNVIETVRRDQEALRRST